MEGRLKTKTLKYRKFTSCMEGRLKTKTLKYRKFSSYFS